MTVEQRPSAGNESDLAAARARIAELEARTVEHERSEKVQAALYRIAETAAAAQDMPSFYATIHEIIGELMHADNFYIALYDEERQRINYPYYVDEFDTDLPDPNVWDPIGANHARGVTAYAIRLGRPLRLDVAAWRDLLAQGEIEQLGVTTDESSWIGAPLVADGAVLGLICVQGYTAVQRFSDADRDLLAFVGQ